MQRRLRQPGATHLHLACQRTNHVGDLAQLLGQVQTPALQLELAGTDARQVEQVVDDLRLAAHRALDGLGSTARQGYLAQHRRTGQQLAVELDEIERVLEFMGHHREELVLELAQRLTLGQVVGRFTGAYVIGGGIPGDLGVALTARGVAHTAEHPGAVQPAAVLASQPAFVVGDARFPGLAHLGVRYLGGDVFRGEDQAHWLAQGLALAVAEQPGGPAVPAVDDAGGIQGDDGVVLDVLRHQAHVFLAGAGAILGQAPVGDVDEGQHRTLDAILGGAIGQQSRQVPALVLAAHLALDQPERFEDLVGVGGQLGIVQPMGDVEQRTPGIADDHVEDAHRARGESLDAHAAIDEHRGDVGGGDEVLQIVVDLAGFLDLGFELVVDGDQFFVDRLQFFLAGLQFLGGRPQFLVDRLQLFVGRLELLGRGLGLLDGQLQLLLGSLQLGLQLGEHAVLGLGVIAAGVGAHDVLDFVEEHQHVVGTGVAVAEGAHHHVDVVAAVVALDMHATRLDALVALQRLEQCRTQLQAQFLQHQRWQAVAGLAADVAQKAPGPLGHVHDIGFAVDDDARRRVLLQHPLMHLGEGHLLAPADLVRRQTHAVHARIEIEQRRGPYHAGGVLGAVDAVLLVHRGEQAALHVGRLGAAEEQIATRLEGEMEGVQDLGLHLAIQIDQQVAAADEIQAGKRRIAEQVVLGEQHLLAQLLFHPVLVLLLEQVLAQARGGDVGDDGARIDAMPGHRQGMLVEIGGEHLQPGAGLAQLGLFGQQHGQRIGFLATGTGGAPDAQFLVVFVDRQVLEQLRNDIALQGLEGLAIAKEVGHADEHVLEQRRRLFRMLMEKAGIGRHVGDGVDLHAPLHPAQHRGGLVLLEIVSGAGAQQGEDVA